MELWFCCVDNHWPYSKSAKAIQTALNRHQDQSHTTHNQQPTQTLSGLMQSRPRQSSSSRKSSGINPSGYGGTICIDFSRSSIRNAKKKKRSVDTNRTWFLHCKVTLDANDLGLGFNEGTGSGKLFRQLSVFNCQQRELHPYVQEEGRGDCFQSMLEGLPMRVPSPPGNEPPTIHH